MELKQQRGNSKRDHKAFMKSPWIEAIPEYPMSLVPTRTHPSLPSTLLALGTEGTGTLSPPGLCLQASVHKLDLRLMKGKTITAYILLMI